jgi:hypothetical protein
MAVARCVFNSKQVDTTNYIDAGGKNSVDSYEVNFIQRRLSLDG